MMTNAMIAGSIGLAAAFLAAFSRWADMRRLRRTNPDAVGFMPWTGIYFVALFVACVTLGVAAKGWFAG
jgi:hypothetical protein